MNDLLIYIKDLESNTTARKITEKEAFEWLNEKEKLKSIKELTDPIDTIIAIQKLSDYSYLPYTPTPTNNGIRIEYDNLINALYQTNSNTDIWIVYDTNEVIDLKDYLRHLLLDHQDDYPRETIILQVRQVFSFKKANTNDSSF